MMSSTGYTVFETAIGPCGIAWGAAGIIGVQLPAIPPSQTGTYLARRFPGAQDTVPTAPVQRAVDGIVALLRGEPADLSGIELDLTGVPEFQRRIYAIARAIPPGATLTYGEIARRLGQPDAARAVGRALARNPIPIFVPCHRVLAAGGGFGGFSAPGGLAAKARLLTIERAQTSSAPALFEDLPIAVRPKGSA